MIASPPSFPRIFALFSLCVFLVSSWVVPAAASSDSEHDFELYNLKGALYDLARIRQSEGAKVVVVDFFEVSCIPCRKGLVRWAEIHKELSAKGFRMVVVALPGPEDRATAEQKLQTYFREHPVPFPVVFDKYKNVAKLYGVVKDDSARIPQAFIINAKGAVKAQGQGPEDLEAKLRKEFK